MTPRSIRRAAERKAKKLARKAERQLENLSLATTNPTAETPEIAANPTPAAHPEPAPQPVDFSAISPAQLLANRANAQLSTGPRTAGGLARSSTNAVKTALTGRTVLLPTDDVEEYAAFIKGFQDCHAPVGPVECELVQDIADCFWRVRRIRALEFALYAHGHKQFENAFDDAPEEDRYNLILLQTDMTYQKQFRNYQIHEARIERTRSKKLAELLRLQAERRANEAEAETADDEDIDDSDMDALFQKYLPFVQAYEAKQNPANGFVFSNAHSQAAASSETAPEALCDHPQAA